MKLQIIPAVTEVKIIEEEKVVLTLSKDEAGRLMSIVGKTTGEFSSEIHSKLENYIPEEEYVLKYQSLYRLSVHGLTSQTD